MALTILRGGEVPGANSTNDNIVEESLNSLIDPETNKHLCSNHYPSLLIEFNKLELASVFWLSDLARAGEVYEAIKPPCHPHQKKRTTDQWDQDYEDVLEHNIGGSREY